MPDMLASSASLIPFSSYCSLVPCLLPDPRMCDITLMRTLTPHHIAIH